MNSTFNQTDEYCDPALQKTFQVLATTANTCAETTLITALDSPSAEIVTAAAKRILIRKSDAGKQAIVRHWDSLKVLLTPIFDLFPGRMVDTLAANLSSSDSILQQLSLRIAIDICEYDFVPHLLPHVENRRSSLHQEAEAALGSLTQSLYDETHGKRSYAKKRDPQLARARVTLELEKCLGRFEQHRNQSILTSFLALAGRENSQVVRYLSLVDSAAVVNQETAKLLRSSTVPGVMRLLASFLDDQHAPLMALQIAASRKDGEFVEECLRRIAIGDRNNLAQNLGKISTWQWLTLREETWKTLYESEQAAAVTWAVLSGIPLARKLEILQWSLQHGRAGARLQAAESLAQFRDEEANQLVLGHLHDVDPRVRAALLNQLRSREIPSAVAKLVAALEDRDPIVRSTVQKHLPEYRFRRFADLFDSMEPPMQAANAKIVRRADPDWKPQLEAELRSDVRVKKMRALRMAQCLSAGNEVFRDVLPAVRDEEALVRQLAIGVLSQSSASEAIAAIRQCLLDEQVSVRCAAEEALSQRGKVNGQNELNASGSQVELYSTANI